MAKKENKKFLIYKITNLLNQKIYVGAHITNNINDKYMGSSKHLLKDIKKLGRQNFTKEILFVFDNKKDMIKKEAEIVNKEFCFREDTYNRMIGGISGSFNYEGMTTVKDKKGEILKVYIDDPRYLSGELTQVTKGTVPVIDQNGNNLRVSKDDPKYLSGELKFNCTGKVPVKDSQGRTLSVSKDDPRYLSGELKYINCNQVTVIDKLGNCFNVDISDQRYLSGELKHNLNGTIVVKDKKGDRFVVAKNDPRYLSGELVGWAKGRPGIKGMLGKNKTESEKQHLRDLAKLRTGNQSSAFGKSYINNNILNKRVPKEDVDKWLASGWILGKIPKRTKESVINAAKQFSTKMDFIKNDRKNYDYAQKHGWLEECYKHLK